MLSEMMSSFPFYKYLDRNYSIRSIKLIQKLEH